MIATEGQVLDVVGTQCTSVLSSDYLIKVGEVPFLDRPGPPALPGNGEFFITAANDGHTIAGLVDRGSDPDVFDCADGCSLIKVDQATRKLIAKIPLKLPLSLGPVLSAYDGLCDALTVSYRDKAKPDQGRGAHLLLMPVRRPTNEPRSDAVARAMTLRPSMTQYLIYGPTFGTQPVAPRDERRRPVSVPTAAGYRTRAQNAVPTLGDLTLTSWHGAWLCPRHAGQKQLQDAELRCGPG